MTTCEVFIKQLECLRRQVKQDERVRVEALGIEARRIQGVKGGPDGNTIIIHGFDIHGVETVLICPASHFSASLSIVAKQSTKQVLGFKQPETSGAEVLLS